MARMNVLAVRRDALEGLDGVARVDDLDHDPYIAYSDVNHGEISESFILCREARADRGAPAERRQAFMNGGVTGDALAMPAKKAGYVGETVPRQRGDRAVEVAAFRGEIGVRAKQCCGAARDVREYRQKPHNVYYGKFIERFS